MLSRGNTSSTSCAKGEARGFTWSRRSPRRPRPASGDGAGLTAERRPLTARRDRNPTLTRAGAAVSTRGPPGRSRDSVPIRSVPGCAPRSWPSSASSRLPRRRQ
jgi:hypothetical protein